MYYVLTIDCIVILPGSLSSSCLFSFSRIVLDLLCTSTHNELQIIDCLMVLEATDLAVPRTLGKELLYV